MKATLEYELPKEQEAFVAALHGPAYCSLLNGMILRLTKLAHPDNAPEHRGLVRLLRQLEQQMEEGGLNRSFQFGDGESE